MKSVLIVDDSPTETYTIRKILEEYGFKVSEAADGKSGYEKAVTECPDIIIMDVVMPGLNGFQVTRQLSKNKKTAEIPVIIVTTKDQETDRVWAKRQGASDYLVKPVDATGLVAAIRALLPNE